LRKNYFHHVENSTAANAPKSPAVRRMTGSGRPKVQSVDRTLDVLEALATRRGASGISELSQLVGLHVSTVHRLLATLVDRGYVRQDPDSSRYHLGSRIFTLANAADLHLDLRLVARPYLERLMRNSGETANLVTCTENEVVYLDQVASLHLVKMFTTPGLRAPLYCTGTGKAFLAFKGTAFAEPVLAAPMRRYTPRTIVTRAALEAELATIRKQGFSIDNEEMEEGVRCLAVPIFDRHSECIGAMSVSGPITRMTPERVAKLSHVAKQIALDCSHQLGYESEAPAQRATNSSAQK
jgi:DNA-binding IclR family transcriptional regulator